MNTESNKLPPVPPTFTTAFKSGFNTVANHVQIILFPILLDLFLLLGPQFRISKLFAPLFNEMVKISQTSVMQQIPQAEQTLAFDALKEFISRINLLSILSTFPLGIPSILSPGVIENPLGIPTEVNLSSFAMTFSLIFLLYLLGLGLSTLFYNRLAELSSDSKSPLTLKTLSWQYLQILSFSVWLFIIICVIIIPVFFLINLLQLVSPIISQILVFLFVFLLLWLGFPLVFTPHGIFAYNQNVFSAAFTSYRLVRLALPSSGLFMSLVLLVYLGAMGLWVLPPENSWLILAGIAGHAFLFSGLIVSTFYYYRGSIEWMREAIKRSTQSSIRSI